MRKMTERRRSRSYIVWFFVIVVLGVVAFVVVLAYVKNFRIGSFSVSKKYGDALKVATQFFDVQKSGKLVNNTIPWRGDSALKDREEANIDLSKGMYDAGDHMKSEILNLTNKCWDRPEDMSEKRPLTKVTASKPGSDVAAETASEYDIKCLDPVQVLLPRVSFLGPEDASDMENINEYRKTPEAIMCNILPNSLSAKSSRTKGGLIWVSKWHALQQPADYVLGDNPMKMSYLVGYGDSYPKYVHHRGASIPADATTSCKDGMKCLISSKPNPNVATGALVGGPSKNDKYIDSRNNSMQGELSTYNSAVLVGLLSGLVSTSSVPKSFM
ncbi:Endoglucanase 24 [Artemisia annua]|uniref:Endoglucanase n=1 Tax=Artemisia annua TaxID=35608 RepID=A0A2U1M7B7_ARTAN|nr:Endoglucanase 24 [Artemisia annua]